MTFLGTLIGTAVAFSAIMLAVSIIIMYLVRLVHYLGNVRGRSLGEMVGALNIGFRLENGDPADAGDAPQSAFVTDILTYPMLHPAAKLSAPVSRMGGDASKIEASRQKAAQSVEYIAKADLLEIVCRLNGQTYSQKPLLGEFPQRWCNSLAAEKRSLAALVFYIEQWFETTEAVSTDQFKKASKRLTAVLACIVVVVLNMDGFRLVANLYGKPGLRDDLAQRAPDLQDMGRRSGATDERAPLPTSREALLDSAPPATHGVDKANKNVAPDSQAPDGTTPHATADVGALVSLLDQPDLGLGWQHSWIAEAMCVAARKCPPVAGVVPPSCFGWVVSIGGWLAGLGFSSLLLSMGAPFWARTLENALSLKSAIKDIQTDDSPNDTPNDTPNDAHGRSREG
jgi:hypothetical protein